MSSALNSLRASSCAVVKQGAILVAMPEETLCGTEHFFGTNCLGALPMCAVHTHTASKDLHCLSQVDGEDSRIHI